MSRINALVARVQQSLNPGSTATFREDTADRNDRASGKEKALSTDTHHGPRTTRARGWVYLYLAIFGDESNAREVDPEDGASDPADTTRG